MTGTEHSLPDCFERKSFSEVFRGYDKVQVDGFVAQMEDVVAALAAEREEARQHVHVVKAEMTSLHRAANNSGCDYSNQAGSRIDQMLQLAQAEAGDILSQARREANTHRAEASQALSAAHAESTRLMTTAREVAASARRDCEVALRARRAAEETDSQRLLLAAQNKVRESEATAGRILNAAIKQAKRILREAERLKTFKSGEPGLSI